MAEFPGVTEEPQQQFSLFGFLFGLGFTVLVLMAAGVTFLSFKEYYYDGNFLPVDTISIKGNLSQLSVERISQDLSQAGFLQNYIRLDVNDVQKLVQQIPWVQNVAVRKQWPSSLFLNVTEKHADARWGDHRLFSREAGIFEAPEEGTYSGLVLLTGPDDQSAQVYDQYRNFQRILASSGFVIARVNMTDRRSWEVYLENGPYLILGREQDKYKEDDEDVVRGRLKRFLKVYPFIQNRDQIAYLDLRYDSGLAVGWKMEEAVGDQEKNM